jgi:hypothetical protein
MIGGQGTLFGRAVTSFIAFLSQPDGWMSVVHGASSKRLTHWAAASGVVLKLARRHHDISLSSTLSRTGHIPVSLLKTWSHPEPLANYAGST